MKSYQRWIWQLPEWPSLVFDAQQIQTRLSEARKSQGLLLGKAEMIGLEGLQPHIRDSLTQEALTTSAIEGENLDPESVRSSVARRLGLDTSGAPIAEGKRNIEGLIDVLQDATLNIDSPLTLERLCNWHGALFPTGFSERISQTSTPTAARDLIELERLGLLNKYGAGRSTRYYPAIEGWAQDDAKPAPASGTSDL
jgi:Fic family protein